MDHLDNKHTITFLRKNSLLPDNFYGEFHLRPFTDKLEFTGNYSPIEKGASCTDILTPALSNSITQGFDWEINFPAPFFSLKKVQKHTIGLITFPIRA